MSSVGITASVCIQKIQVTPLKFPVNNSTLLSVMSINM